MSVTSIQSNDPSIEKAQWQARVELAAAHRLAVIHEFNEGIFNHFTLIVPGTTEFVENDLCGAARW